MLWLCRDNWSRFSRSLSFISIYRCPRKVLNCVLLHHLWRQKPEMSACDSRTADVIYTWSRRIICNQLCEYGSQQILSMLPSHAIMTQPINARILVNNGRYFAHGARSYIMLGTVSLCISSWVHRATLKCSTSRSPSSLLYPLFTSVIWAIVRLKGFRARPFASRHDVTCSIKNLYFRV